MCLLILFLLPLNILLGTCCVALFIYYTLFNIFILHVHTSLTICNTYKTFNKIPAKSIILLILFLLYFTLLCLYIIFYSHFYTFTSELWYFQMKLVYSNYPLKSLVLFLTLRVFIFSVLLLTLFIYLQDVFLILRRNFHSKHRNLWVF